MVYSFEDVQATITGPGGTISLGAGAAKELWDLSGHGDPSWKDLAADVAGTVLGLAVSFAVDVLISQASSPSQARSCCRGRRCGRTGTRGGCS